MPNQSYFKVKTTKTDIYQTEFQFLAHLVSLETKPLETSIAFKGLTMKT